MATAVAATTAAVSVRRRWLPSVISSKPFASAKVISSGEKSPSGPIKMRIFSFFKNSRQVLLPSGASGRVAVGDELPALEGATDRLFEGG